jgi:serine/threonine protein kinase
MSSVRSLPLDAPQLDFDLQLARLPKKKARKVADGQEQYFIETVTGNKRVCRNFPFCSCESCRTALACSGYVCLIAEKSSAATRQEAPAGRALLPFFPYSLGIMGITDAERSSTNHLILPSDVLLRLSADAKPYFADTRLLKEALDVMAEERKWLEMNTAQAKTHFGSNYAAGVAIGKTLVDAGKGWVQRASEIMFQDSGKLKIDIVTMTRQPARKLPLLAVELDQIWSEDMLRDPGRVGGFSACLGCLPGCSDCSAGLPFFVAMELAATINDSNLESCLELLEKRKNSFDNVYDGFAIFMKDLETKLAPQFEFWEHCGNAQEVLTGYSKVTKGTDSHLGQRDRVTTTMAKRNHQISEEQHRVADSELKRLRENQAAKQAAYQAVQDEIRAVQSGCSDLPAGSLKESMLGRLNNRSQMLEEDFRLSAEWIKREEKYVTSCREYAAACLQRVKDSEVESSRLDSCQERVKNDKQYLQDQQQNVVAQMKKTEELLIQCRLLQDRLTEVEEKLSTLRRHTSRIHAVQKKGANSISRMLAAFEKRVRAIGPAFHQSVLEDMSLDLISLLLLVPQLLELKTPGYILDKFVEHRLNGSNLFKVIKNIENPQLVSKELDELLADILGIKDVCDRKRVLHLILVFYHGLSVQDHFPPGDICEDNPRVCCWTCEKVQQTMKLHGLEDHLISLLANVSGEVFMWLDLKRKDLDEIGIKSIADQEKLKTLIKTLTENDPIATQLQGKKLRPQVCPSQPYLGDKGAATDSPSRGPNGIWVLPYAAVREACDGFSPVHELGRGGFGVVYHGQLTLSRDKTAAYAVKKLERSGMQGHSEFWKEVEVLTLCRHPNVVPLVAITVDQEEPCLIYPLMTGGSLAMRIRSQERPLKWKSRLLVAVDVLRAIVYLHHEDGRKPAIMHRDIKPDNVLLDSSDRARLADVGLARLVERRGDAAAGIATTSKLVGTFGYICPAFSAEGRYYPSSDGYGIGVLLLQLLTSQNALDPDQNARPRELAAKMRRAGRETTALAADPAVGTWSPTIARSLADVAISLVQVEELDRMPCSEALAKLEPLLEGLDMEIIPEGRMCILCETDLRNVRFQPCGHMLLCEFCLPAAYQGVTALKCYQCRSEVAETSPDFPQTDTFVRQIDSPRTFVQQIDSPR